MRDIRQALRAGVTTAIALALVIAFLFGTIAPAAPAGAQGPKPPPPGTDKKADKAPEYAQDELLVRFKPAVSPKQADQAIRGNGMGRIRSVRGIDVHVLRVPPGLTVEKAVERMQRHPAVEFAEPNYFISIAETVPPAPGSDPAVSHLWAPQKIAAPAAWDVATGDPSVVIAVVDTGVDYLHSELAQNVVQGWDFYNNDADPMDDHFHGTHVAGIAAAAATDNAAGMIGVCPTCKIMPIKVLSASGSGTMDVVASGITYAADNGAKVINLSLGASAGSDTLASAIDYAWSRGLVIVAAAGNDGKETRSYPGAYPSVITVASSNEQDYHSCFSNWSDGYVEVAAPGELIYSTTPRDAAGNDTYATYSGTSMATPHVAGLAGLLFAQGPTRTNAQVRTLIETTTEDLGAPGPDAYFGNGRINAYRAVMADSSATTPPAGAMSVSALATGYPNSRKLARDDAGTLHLVWPEKSGAQYRVLYATSTDGTTWTSPQVVSSSTIETYSPALAVDDGNVYVAFAIRDGSTACDGGCYSVHLASKLLGDQWPTTVETVTLLGDTYNAVRPSLFADRTSGTLHLDAASLDDRPYVYYASSLDGGRTWSPPNQVSVSSDNTQNSRYSAAYAAGNSVTIAARTVELSSFFGMIVPTFRAVTVTSADGGATWGNRVEHASYLGFGGGEYGLSLSGEGNLRYLAYENAGSVYFRQTTDGTSWTAAFNVGAGSWPSITQSADGQGWVAWTNSDGGMMLRRYTAGSWRPAETVQAGSALCKTQYPNLKQGTSGGRLEWVATSCPGAPFTLSYGSRSLADLPPVPSVRISTVATTVDEPAGPVALTVSLSNATADTVTVKYASSDGTAKSYSDYTPKSGTLTFNAGETFTTISIPISNDTMDEPDETFTVALSAPTNASLGSDSSVTVTIVDNDAPPTVRIGSTYVQENLGDAVVTASLSAASGFTVLVDYSTADGPAKAGADYVATTGTLTFTPGETRKSFAVPIVDDKIAEPNESFTAGLANAVNATIGSATPATITIYANDSVALSAASYYVQENAGQAAITVRLSGPSDDAVTVAYATSDITALASSDYTATSGMLTFAPGDTSETILVPIVDDSLPEANETLKIAISDANGAELGATTSATVTIYASDSIGFASNTTYVQENVGSVTLTVKLSGPSSVPVTVDYVTADGTALAGLDYVAKSGTVTFAPGDTSETIAVPIVDDSLPEGNEAVRVSLSNPDNASLGTTSATTVTIYGSDTVSFSLGSAYVQENAGSVTLTVKLNGPSNAPVSVDYATANGTALAGLDYVAKSGTVTFAPGDTSETITVPIVDDDLPEGNETFKVTLSSPVNAALGTTSSATVTVYGSDTVGFSVSGFYSAETAGSATVTVRLNGPSSQTVTVDYATADGTAVAGVDYIATSGTLTFGPGETSKTFTVTIIDDTLKEPNETIKLTLSNAVNASIGTYPAVTITIFAND